MLIISLLINNMVSGEVFAKKKSTEEKKWIFIGDSYTIALKQYGLIDKDDYVFAKVSTAPRDWFDRRSSLYVDYLNDISDIKADTVSGIVYLYGVNDATCSYNEKYSKKLLDELSNKFTDVPIYVQSVFPVAKTKSNYKDFNTAINSLNDFLKEYCKEEDDNVTYLDTAKKFRTKYGNLKSAKTKDGVHLDKENFKEYFTILKDAIGY